MFEDPNALILMVLALVTGIGLASMSVYTWIVVNRFHPKMPFVIEARNGRWTNYNLRVFNGVTPCLLDLLTIVLKPGTVIGFPLSYFETELLNGRVVHKAYLLDGRLFPTNLGSYPTQEFELHYCPTCGFSNKDNPLAEGTECPNCRDYPKLDPKTKQPIKGIIKQTTIFLSEPYIQFVRNDAINDTRELYKILTVDGQTNKLRLDTCKDWFDAGAQAAAIMSSNMQDEEKTNLMRNPFYYNLMMVGPGFIALAVVLVFIIVTMFIMMDPLNKIMNGFNALVPALADLAAKAATVKGG